MTRREAATTFSPFGPLPICGRGRKREVRVLLSGFQIIFPTFGPPSFVTAPHCPLAALREENKRRSAAKSSNLHPPAQAAFTPALKKRKRLK